MDFASTEGIELSHNEILQTLHAAVNAGIIDQLPERILAPDIILSFHLNTLVDKKKVPDEVLCTALSSRQIMSLAAAGGNGATNKNAARVRLLNNIPPQRLNSKIIQALEATLQILSTGPHIKELEPSHFAPFYPQIRDLVLTAPEKTFKNFVDVELSPAAQKWLQQLAELYLKKQTKVHHSPQQPDQACV